MASKRAIRRRRCGTKRGFASEQLARNAVFLIRRETGNRMEPYRCPFCRQWHIGHRGAA